MIGIKKKDKVSRSKRSQPITGITTAESERDWKRDANRKLRRAVNQAFINCTRPIRMR